ncbi:MAG TPA: T9SS type A sorting domain-containing protein, partial [Saprospiraceae bacterium]|nr:T9SS type A sorting domain-containing protein [Saprospiraceae bacterium]
NVLTPNAQPGDIGLIEVQLGDANYPAINLGGYSYELDYNLSVVDENSLAVSFYQKGWATLNSALMHMFKKPWNGRLESGFVRANGNRVSGKGGVEVISFIVEDNLDGFRKGERFVKIPFYFSNIITVDEHGQLKSLTDQVAYINIGIRSEEDEAKLDPSKLLVYPNPAPEWMNIHLNGVNEMEDISIISVNGAEIKKIKPNDSKHHVLNLNGIQNGLYLLIVNTKLGPITKKIEIFR